MANNLIGIPFVSEHVQRALDQGEQWYRQSRTSLLRYFLTHTQLESPLEGAFLAWWLITDDIQTPADELLLSPQEPIELSGQSFRIDFVIKHQDVVMFEMADRFKVPMACVALELDGHDFHERTKEQVTYRNQRDRALLTAGWSVLHVSGSEFHRDPVACVKAIRRDALSVFTAFRRQLVTLECNAKTPEEREADAAILRGVIERTGAV